MDTKLTVVVPCYQEEAVLPVTSRLLLDKLDDLTGKGKISPESRILFVDDGSSDGTWDMIQSLHRTDRRYAGIRLSRNRGHQNALLAGLMEARACADITISIDCDGQDDVGAMEAMVDAYHDGCDIVYGVRQDRSSDTFFKRTTAQGFYKLLSAMGAEVVYNHADYRLLSARVLDALAEYREVNLYLRGLIPLVGFRSTCVAYDRRERMAGGSHYSLRKMAALALDGVTSLSVRPLRMIAGIGGIVTLIFFAGAVWSMIAALCSIAVPGWVSMTCILGFLGGVQLVSLGVVGEYVGKIYQEVKARPRYLVSDRTEENPSQGQ